MDQETKICPFCAESIRVAAIKCKDCGSDISSDQQEEAVPKINPRQGLKQGSSRMQKFHFISALLIIVLLYANGFITHFFGVIGIFIILSSLLNLLSIKNRAVWIAFILAIILMPKSESKTITYENNKGTKSTQNNRGNSYTKLDYESDGEQRMAKGKVAGYIRHFGFPCGSCDRVEYQYSIYGKAVLKVICDSNKKYEVRVSQDDHVIVEEWKD